MFHRLFYRGWPGIAALVLCALAQPAHADGYEFFERQVRPVLAEHCYPCHNAERQRSGLRLDHGTFVMQGGETGAVVVAGNPGASRLVEAVRYANVDLQMPPSGKLPDDAIAALERWVAEGAAWPDEPVPDGSVEAEEFDLAQRKAEHWAWQPVTKPEIPAVQAVDWAANPIDHFILAKLEDAGLKPAGRAEKHQLLRRAYFDLVGLPPSAEEVRAFLADDSPDAYEKVVDRLLASEHFGERWGRHWLDLMRYAETYGHEQDYPIRHAWRYRDYVIRALNADLPYDQFVTEHIAGDLLPEPRTNPETGLNESITATGFWYMHQATHAPVDVRVDYADRMDNQVDVLSKAFLGMTVSCARCHEHKFDAISTEDFYALTGFLKSSRQQFAYLDPHNKIAEAKNALWEHRAEGDAALAREIEAWIKDEEAIAPYLLAVHEVFNGSWRDGDGAAYTQPNITFDDFESGKFNQWIVEDAGMAESLVPRDRLDPKEVRGFGGHWLLNTLPVSTTGTLRSVPFTIERGFIHFKIAGTKKPEESGFRLRINGETVLEAAGGGGKVLEQRVWDVRPHVGQIAVLEAYDLVEGDAAYVLLDDVVFSSRESGWRQRRPAARVAEENGLDPFRLMRWVNAFESGEVERADHPMHTWWSMTRFRRDAHLPGVEWHAKEHEKRHALPEGDILFEDFRNGLSDWFVLGDAFVEQPQNAAWRPHGNDIRLTANGVADSGLLAPNLQGTIRSQDFTLTHDRIHIRAMGRNTRIRLVVEGYELREYNGLLFGDTLFDVNTDGRFHWFSMRRDTPKFRGATAYLEFIDDGDGYIVVDEIRFSNNDEPHWGADPLAKALLTQHVPGDTSLAGLAASYDKLLKQALEDWQRNAAEPDAVQLVNWLLEHKLLSVTRDYRDLVQVAKGMGENDAALPQPVRVLAIMDGTPRNDYVHIRGGYKNVGGEVPRRFLEALAGVEQPPVGDGSGRLALAKRLLAADNPLPARVMANRVWHYLTGRGIVPTVDNFGVLGELPTHPELLDHLATEFTARGWSVKSLIKYVMLSSAYRMNSAPLDLVAEEHDPDNTLLHRARLRRLEGEAIRDSILAVAGTLNNKMYGESVTAHLSDFMRDNRAPARSGPMDGDRRRTIYLEVRRNYLSPMMQAFDMPLPDTTIGRRTVSNVPAQSLILMNDPFVQDQARSWGETLASSALDVDAKLDALYLSALARTPSPQEREQLRTFMEEQAKLRDMDTDSGMRDPHIWADVCHVMFALKEFIFVG